MDVALERMIAPWRLIAEPLQVGIAVTEGAEHRLVYVNPAFARLAPGSGGSAGARAEEVFGSTFLRPILPLMDGALARADPASRTLEASGQGEDRALYQATVSPLVLEGDVAGSLIQLEDQSEQLASLRRHADMQSEIREVNQRLILSALREQELAERAEVAARARSDFLSAMSHELRTPLTAIVGYAEVLETEVMGPLNEKQQKSAQRIRLSAAHLKELINQILDFQQIEATGARLTRSRIDAGDVARESVDMVKGLAAGALEIRADLPDGPVPMETDPQKLRQVLVNLLANAIKFTEEGWVELRVESEDERIRFVVADTGVGITEDELEEIFQPFHQLDRGYTRTVDGTGLGLSISRSLAELLGGTIEVESTPGEGSTFTVTVPARMPGEG